MASFLSARFYAIYGVIIFLCFHVLRACLPSLLPPRTGTPNMRGSSIYSSKRRRPTAHGSGREPSRANRTRTCAPKSPHPVISIALTSPLPCGPQVIQTRSQRGHTYPLTCNPKATLPVQSVLYVGETKAQATKDLSKDSIYVSHTC